MPSFGGLQLYLQSRRAKIAAEELADTAMDKFQAFGANLT
jgi:hypothetical protein